MARFEAAPDELERAGRRVTIAHRLRRAGLCRESERVLRRAHLMLDAIERGRRRPSSPAVDRG